MSQIDPHAAHEKFGTVLGYAPGHVPAYSSDYASADDRELPNRQAYRHVLDGIYMGHKWQCVEFARRWLYLNKGYIFSDVGMAYDIFSLKSVRDVRTNALLPLHSFENGSRRHPEPGCMLIWNEGGEFAITGHVAIVTEVFPDHIRVAEQNVNHRKWDEGCDYSRELKARTGEDGSYWIHCSFGDAEVLGWVLQTDDARLADDVEPPEPALFSLELKQAEPPKDVAEGWLNLANEDEAVFVRMMGGHKLSSRDEDIDRYFVMSETAVKELKRATNELHSLFMHATNHVLQHEEVLEKFNLPRAIWPRIRQSWDNRRNQMITGRFDFCMTPTGLKVYEYNADSASCHMETGKVQDKWATHYEVEEGRSAGDRLHSHLVEAWKASKVDGLLHIMQDEDMEETYHALFMKEAMERAGISCRIIRGLSALHWSSDGRIVDDEGDEVRWVWKTWAWETALDQLRAECEEDTGRLSHYEFDQVKGSRPRLVDVLLRREVMVFEPLWTLIPSNKAILPVLWQMFPDHAYLLDTRFDLVPSLKAKGYAAKPIAGRCGHNISLVDSGDILVETGGRFDQQDMIYQELCMLPVVHGYSAQVCTFSVGGSYAATCIRADKTAVITKNSDVLPLRIIQDDDLLEGQ